MRRGSLCRMPMKNCIVASNQRFSPILCPPFPDKVTPSSRVACQSVDAKCDHLAMAKTPGMHCRLRTRCKVEIHTGCGTLIVRTTFHLSVVLASRTSFLRGIPRSLLRSRELQLIFPGETTIEMTLRLSSRDGIF